MARRDIKQIRAALDVVRESEALRLCLKVSIRSSSSTYELINSGLGDYLIASKKELQRSLIAAEIKVGFFYFSGITKTLLRVVWSRIKRSKIGK